MIFAPRGWTRRVTADGIVIFPPLPSGPGPAAGHAIYRERVRPLGPVLDIFRRELAEIADVEVALLRPRLVITNEGEYAAVVTVRDRSGQVQHDLGVVLLDDFYSLLHAVTRDRSQFAASSAMVLELVQHDTHQLGDRRRRYLYAEPPTWQGRPRGLETDYFPLDYPQQELMLTVMPALPKPLGASSIKYINAMLAWHREEFTVTDVGGPIAVRTPLLQGSEMKWTCAREDRLISRRATVLEDERFLYPVLLEGSGDLAAARESFVGIIHSIEPIPATRSANTSRSSSAMSMWEG